MGSTPPRRNLPNLSHPKWTENTQRTQPAANVNHAMARRVQNTSKIKERTMDDVGSDGETKQQSHPCHRETGVLASDSNHEPRGFSRKILKLILKSAILVLSQVYASPRYVLILICCVAALVVAPPFLLVLHVVVRFLQFDSRNDGYEIVAQLKLYARLLSYADMVFLVLCGIIYYVIMPLFADHEMSIITLISYWLYISVPMFMILFMFDVMFVSLVLPKMPTNHTHHSFVLAINLVTSVYMTIQMQMEEHSSDFSQYNQLFLLKWFREAFLSIFGWQILVKVTGILGQLTRHKVYRILDNQDAANSVSVLQYRIAEKVLHGKHLVYYAKRLKTDINAILMETVGLYLWRIYFGWHVIKITTIEEEEKLWKGGLLLILFILMLLVLLVTKCHRLSREARTVYYRFESRIIKVAKELYFLGILGRHTYDIFNLRYKSQVIRPLDSSLAQVRLLFDITPDLERHYMTGDEDAEDDWGEGRTHQNNFVTKLSRKKREVYKKQLFWQKGSRPWTLDDIHKASQCFLEALEQLSKTTYTSDILSNLQTFIPSTDRCIRESLRQLVNGKINQGGEAKFPETRENDDWESFEELLKTVVSPKESISLAEVKTWLERAHSNCFSLANLLHRSIKAVEYLDNIIHQLVFVGFCITSLVIMDTITTREMVLIASPILAVAFVFGDTCKTMFQGMIFIYVVHPFDVGDLCVLDKNMMVVRSFDIWKTTFTKVDNVGTREEVIYPNSELAGKKLINHRTEFDWSDCVEFNFPTSVDGQEINKLKRLIENHLDDNKNEFSPESYSIRMSDLSSVENNNVTIITIHYTYNGSNVRDWTYIECFRRKEKLNWNFRVYIRDLLKQLGELKIPHVDKDNFPVEVETKVNSDEPEVESEVPNKEGPSMPNCPQSEKLDDLGDNKENGVVSEDKKEDSYNENMGAASEANDKVSKREKNFKPVDKCSGDKMKDDHTPIYKNQIVEDLKFVPSDGMKNKRKRNMFV